jgi:hypothetical protein
MTDPKNTSPKHGSSPSSSELSTDHKSVSQADGTAADAPRGETEAQPKIKSETPEGRDGKINPSAPNDATSTMPSNTTRDSAGEIGEPSGEGTLDAPKSGQTSPDSKPKDELQEKDEEAA